MSTLRGPIFILSPETITIDSTASSAAQTGFALTNLTDYIHPLRTYRSSADPSGTNIELVIDLGSGIPKVDAIFIDNTNLESWVIQHSSTGTTTGFTDWITGITASIDPLTGRAKVFVDAYDTSANSRYIKLLATAQTPILSPSTAARVGSIVIGTSGNVVSLPSKGVATITYTRNVPVETTEFQGGSVEHVQLGTPYLTIEFPDEPYIRETQEDEILDIINKNITPFVVYENQDYTNRAYVVRHNELETKVTYTVGQVLNLPLSFRECV